MYDYEEVTNYSLESNLATICIWNFDSTKEQEEKYNVLKEMILDEEPMEIWVSGERDYQFTLSEEIKEQLKQAVLIIDEMVVSMMSENNVGKIYFIAFDSDDTFNDYINK